MFSVSSRRALPQDAGNVLSECQSPIRFWHFHVVPCHVSGFENSAIFATIGSRTLLIKVKLRPHHPNAVFGKKVLSFESLDSTNRYAKQILEEEDEGTVVVAEEQTAGRGRMGRTWTSEKGKNLTCSLIIKPSITPEYLGIISLFAGVVVARTITRLTMLNAECKWPNDVLLNRRKCSGILAESTISGGRCTGIVVGIGININQMEFPAELQHTATSLQMETGRRFETSQVLDTLLEEAEAAYPDVRHRHYQNIRNAWLALAPMMGRTVRVTTPEATFQGTAHRIDDRGGLVITRNGNEQYFTVGDVSIRYEHDNTRG